jgi:hypothetical protein
MSDSFRPVKETWGPHSATFIDRASLLGVLGDVARRVGTACNETAYGDTTAFWIEDGKKFLDYIQDDEGFTAAGLQESMEEEGFTFTPDDLQSLVENMKALTAVWRESISGNGELIFYVD